MLAWFAGLGPGVPYPSKDVYDFSKIPALALVIICKWLEVDWEDSGSCHGVIEINAGMHAIHVAYQSE